MVIVIAFSKGINQSEGGVDASLSRDWSWKIFIVKTFSFSIEESSLFSRAIAMSPSAVFNKEEAQVAMSHFAANALGVSISDSQHPWK